MQGQIHWDLTESYHFYVSESKYCTVLHHASNMWSIGASCVVYHTKLISYAPLGETVYLSCSSDCRNQRPNLISLLLTDFFTRCTTCYNQRVAFPTANSLWIVGRNCNWKMLQLDNSFLQIFSCSERGEFIEIALSAFHMKSWLADRY
jgi:hypothetical protein